MAFRLGYQISCNLTNNAIIRNASVGSSRRFRSLSPSCFYGHLKDNVIPNASLAATLLHQRRRPRTSLEDLGVSPVIKTLQNYPTYRNFSQIQPDDDQEVVLGQNRSSLATKHYFTIAKIRKGPVTHKLQPRYINPVATIDINLNSFAPLEEKTPHSAKFLSLKKQAHAQYSKAVKELNRKDEDEDVSYRYQLEAANPRTHDENIFSAVDLRKKLQNAVENAVPQLQPKNIRPFGNIANVQWRAPNVEKTKQLYVVYRNQNEATITNENVPVKKGDSNRDINNSLSTTQQQREYCTAQSANNNASAVAEYKRINSVEKEPPLSVPVIPEKENTDLKTDDSQRNVEIKENRRQNGRYILYKSGRSVYSKRIPESSTSALNRGNFKPLHEAAIFHRPKAHAQPITVKIGPKWKLQSTGRPDIIESVGPLNPGANEKFLVPWPSYADRIKTNDKRPGPSATIADVNDALKMKYDAMFNKIQSDTNALCLKPQNIFPDLSSPNKQNVSVLSREYSTGLRRNEIGKEQRGLFDVRKFPDHSEVLSKLSAIQEKRYASYRGLSSLKLVPKNSKIKLKRLPKSNAPQVMMNVPISNPLTNQSIKHHVSKPVKAKLSRETLFRHIRSKLKQRDSENQFGLQRDDVLARPPYGGLLKSMPSKPPMMMYSTLTRIQQDNPYIRSVYVQKMCCSSRVDESLRILGSYLQPIHVPDRPQVCEGLIKSNLGDPLSKQNLNSMCLFNRSLSDSEESSASIFATVWAKVTEYFGLLNGTRYSERPDLGLQRGGFLSGNFFTNRTQTIDFCPIPSRSYSIFAKYEARRKRKKEPCPCVRKKRGSAIMPALKRLPKHPFVDRPPYKCDPPCVHLSELRADEAGLEPKRKSLPKLDVGDCPCPKKAKVDSPQPTLKRLPKVSYRDIVWKCETWKCEDDAEFRADKNLKEEKKSLPVLVPGMLPELEKKPPKPAFSALKRLPKAPFIDRPPYKCELPCVDLRLFRADTIAHLEVKQKSLRKLEVSDCPCPKGTMKDVPQPKLKRLPKLPIEDRVWECRDVDDCEESNLYRADRGLDLHEKKSLPVLVPGTCPPEEDVQDCPPKSKGKTTPSIFKDNSRKFSTVSNRFETVHGRRSFSTNSDKGSGEMKECKKLAKPGKGGKKQCKQLTLFKCQPAESISCKKKLTRESCKKTYSPYPAFSECKEEDDLPPLTECDVNQKHLQPRWPIISDLFSFQMPPPKQGKIDPSKEEQCVIRKLNLVRSGTKTCENFYAREKVFNAKKMLAKYEDGEEEDDDGDECEEISEYAFAPETVHHEETTPATEDTCLKAAKPKSLNPCGATAKPDTTSPLKDESAKQEKPTPKAACSLPKHDKPCQAPVKKIKSPKKDSPKLTPKDICELTKKRTSPKLNKKSSMLGFFGGGKAKSKTAPSSSRKKIPVTCPRKSVFQRMLEYFFGKPSRPKPLLIEKSEKKVPSTAKLCLKGTTAKTKPVFNCAKAAPAAKKKAKRNDTCETSKSKPAKVTKAAEVKTRASEIKEPSHKVAEITKATLCSDERREEKSKEPETKPSEKEPRVISEVTKSLLCSDERKTKNEMKDEPKLPKHKIAEITKVALCPDECEGESDGEPTGGAEECGGENKRENEVRSGRCRIASYANCPPKARENCDSHITRPPCKAKETPYSSFSDCHRDFPKIPINECTEQEKRFTQQGIELENMSKEQKKPNTSREFSTLAPKHISETCE